MKSVLLISLLLAGLHVPLNAQPFSINWSKIAGGGGTSTGAVFSVSGTIGQADAGVHTGGPYSLVGGFWGFVSVIQTPGAPLLSVANSGGTVIVYWPKPADGFVLDETTALASFPPSTIWSEVPVATYETNATHIFITVPKPEGEKYYRLRKP